MEIFYNGYISPLTQEVRRETLLPLQEADVLGDEDSEDESEQDESGDGDGPDHSRALWLPYEPDPEEILERLAPDYVEISIYRALLESTASEHGARMTAMRSASENAADLIDDLHSRGEQAASGRHHSGDHGSRRGRRGPRIRRTTHVCHTRKPKPPAAPRQQNVGRIEEIQGVVIEAVFQEAVRRLVGWLAHHPGVPPPARAAEEPVVGHAERGAGGRELADPVLPQPVTVARPGTPVPAG